MKKKVWIIILAVVLTGALAAAAVIFGPKLFKKETLAPADGEGIYVDSVAMLTGMDIASGMDFTGVVETEKPKEVQLDQEKTLKELLVKEGQEVKVGDPLFTYDVEIMELKLRQAEIEYDSLQNRIETLNAQVASLEKEKSKAPADQQLSYSLEIQGTQLEIRTEEYNMTLKEAEMDTIKSSIENATVFSEVDGIVTKINDPNAANAGYGEAQQAFIYITGDREYKVKSTITELNFDRIYEGMQMCVISRIDQNQKWSGYISEIDMNPQQNENMNMYYGDESMVKATKYAFYITLDSLDGLMLGQHVYVKPGTADVSDIMELPQMYVITSDAGETYVFVENAAGLIEKRTVTLGEENFDMGTVQILDGLSETDYIAFPMDVEEGMKALHFSDNFME